MHNKTKQHGFSLVEIMVGLGVGAIASVIILQVFSNYEVNRRSVSAGSDAQNSAVFTIYSLDREIQSAGNGFATSQALGCNTVFSSTMLPSPPMGASATPRPLMPIRIFANATAGQPAGLEVIFGDSGMLVPMAIGLNYTNNGTINLINSVSIKANDVLVYAPNANPPTTNCSILRVNSTIPNPLGNDVPLNTTSSNTTPSIGASDWVAHIGNLTVNQYTIVNNSLQLSTTLNGTTSTTLMASDVVNMQAQYGLDDGCGNGASTGTAGDDIIDRWVNAAAGNTLCTNSASGGTRAVTDFSSPSAADVRTIKAVRIGLIIRSPRKENTCGIASPQMSGSTASFPWTNPASQPGTPTMTASVSNITNYSCYRYKLYQTIIPIRSVIRSSIA